MYNQKTYEQLQNKLKKNDYLNLEDLRKDLEKKNLFNEKEKFITLCNRRL